MNLDDDRRSIRMKTLQRLQHLSAAQEMAEAEARGRVDEQGRKVRRYAAKHELVAHLGQKASPAEKTRTPSRKTRVQVAAFRLRQVSSTICGEMFQKRTWSASFSVLCIRRGYPLPEICRDSQDDRAIAAVLVVA
jgi:hypothetical protein